MRSFKTIPAHKREANGHSFQFEGKAFHPSSQIKMVAIFVVALATVIAAGLITLHPSNASHAEGLTSLATQGLASTKTDRVHGKARAKNCAAQTWGAWSDDCAAALTGAGKVRTVSFVTVEKATPTVNETILARYPSN